MRRFIYTDDDVKSAFAAVGATWPSPKNHHGGGGGGGSSALSQQQRSRPRGFSGGGHGDTIKVWWKKVLDANRKALGSRHDADKLTSFLIHEPSIVLWARDRRRRIHPKARSPKNGRPIGPLNRAFTTNARALVQPGGRS